MPNNRARRGVNEDVEVYNCGVVVASIKLELVSNIVDNPP